MAKYKLKTKSKIDAIILEQNMESISAVLKFIYKDGQGFEPQLMPSQEGMIVRTNFGNRFAAWGDVIVKNNDNSITVYARNIFDDLYEPTT